MKLIGRTPVSLRALVGAIGLSVAVITAISIPAGYLFMEYSAVADGLAVKAQRRAARVAKYANIHDTLWQYQAIALADLIEAPGTNNWSDRQRIVDRAGKIVLEVGTVPAYPAMTQAAPIVVRGVDIARLEVSTSVRSLAIATGIIAALSILLGCGLLYAVRALPLRVLARTLGAENAKAIIPYLTGGNV